MIKIKEHQSQLSLSLCAYLFSLFNISSFSALYHKYPISIRHLSLLYHTYISITIMNLYHTSIPSQSYTFQISIIHLYSFSISYIFNLYHTSPFSIKHPFTITHLKSLSYFYPLSIIHLSPPYNTSPISIMHIYPPPSFIHSHIYYASLS